MRLLPASARLLLTLAILLAVSAPEGALACFFVAPGRTPTLEGIRIAARRQVFRVGNQDVSGWDAHLLLAYDVVPEGQAIGVVLPVDPGVGVELQLQVGSEIASTLEAIDGDTMPFIRETRDTSCQGCEVLDPVLPPPEADPVEWQVDWDSRDYRLVVATSRLEVEAWLQRNTFVLSPDTETVIAAALTAGQHIALVTARPGPGPGALQPIRLRWPGALSIPLGLARDCGARDMEITIFASAEQPVTVEGWDTLYLDEIDRDLFRNLPGIPGVYERLASEHDGELFVVEGVHDVSDEVNFGFLWDPTATELFGETGFFTRLRAIANASDLESNAQLQLDPEGHLLSGDLDLRPDPQAHGTSLSGEWMWLGLLLMIRTGRRRH